MTYLRTALSTTAAITLTTLASPAFAQEGSARQGVLSFSQGFELSDNPALDPGFDGHSLTSTTGVGLELVSETTTQVLRFTIGTEYEGEISGDTGDDFDFTGSYATLNYGREGANGRFEFSAAYRERNLDDEVIETDTGFVIDSGTLESIDLSTRIITGIEGPFGLEVGLSYSDNDYTDTADPDLIDSTRTAADVLAHFRVSPDYGYRARAGYSFLDEEDGTETTTTYLGAGIEGETSTGLTYYGDVIFDRSEVTVPGPSTSEDDGIGIEAGITRELSNGSLGFELASRVDDDGRRSSAEVSRSFELPDGGLAFSLGVVDQELDDSLRVIGGLDYTKETPRGGLTASISQDATVDDGSPILNTGVSVGYAEDINEISGWEANVSWFSSNELGGSDDDTRSRASLAYTRELAEDWAMRTGVEHERVSTSGGTSRSSNTVFFTIERDITFGF